MVSKNPVLVEQDVRQVVNRKPGLLKQQVKQVVTQKPVVIEEAIKQLPAVVEKGKKQVIKKKLRW